MCWKIRCQLMLNTIFIMRWKIHWCVFSSQFWEIIRRNRHFSRATTPASKAFRREKVWRACLPLPKRLDKFLKIFIKFLKANQCIGCKAKITDSNKTICDHCTDKEAGLYLGHQYELRKLSCEFNSLWTQCQRCQETVNPLFMQIFDYSAVPF